MESAGQLQLSGLKLVGTTRVISPVSSIGWFSIDNKLKLGWIGLEVQGYECAYVAFLVDTEVIVEGTEVEVRGSKVDAVTVIVTEEGIVDCLDCGRIDPERKNGSHDGICGQVLEYFKVSGLKGELRILVENGDIKTPNPVHWLKYRFWIVGRRLPPEVNV